MWERGLQMAFRGDEHVVKDVGLSLKKVADNGFSSVVVLTIERCLNVILSRRRLPSTSRVFAILRVTFLELQSILFMYKSTEKEVWQFCKYFVSTRRELGLQ